jgi:NADH-quinone oxidoreductase subunit L
MTVPLIVLAFFSVVAGYVSWPKPLHGSKGFDCYLDPVFAPSEEFLWSGLSVGGRTGAVEHAAALGAGTLMILSAIAAFIGIGVAVWLYSKATALPERIAQRFSGLYQLLARKYYVDEIYNWLFVEPIRVGSEKLLWQGLDAKGIDGTLVKGTGEVTTQVGSILRRIQSGNIPSYAAWVLLGTVLWLGYVLLKG